MSYKKRQNASVLYRYGVKGYLARSGVTIAILVAVAAVAAARNTNAILIALVNEFY